MTDQTFYNNYVSLNDDVELLMKRVTELVNSHNKCRSDVVKLADSHRQVTELLRDLRNVVGKETIKKLYDQITTDNQSQFGNLEKKILVDLSTNIDRHVNLAVSNLEMRLSSLQQQLSSSQNTEHINSLIRNINQDISELKSTFVDRTSIDMLFLSMKDELNSKFTSKDDYRQFQNHTNEKLTELNLLTSRKYINPEELNSCVKQEDLVVLLKQLESDVIAPNRLETINDIKRIEDKLLSKEEVKEMISSSIVPVQSTPLFNPEDYVKKEDMMNFVKEQIAKERELLSNTFMNKDIASNNYYTRSEFEAFRTIVLTRNEISAVKVPELETIKQEVDTLKKNSVGRERINLLSCECDNLRENVNLIESRLDGFNTSLTSKTEPYTIKLLTFDDVVFKYLKISDVHLILCDGFNLQDSEKEFTLEDIETPSKPLEFTGDNYTICLEGNKLKVKENNAETQKPIQVKRLLLWF